MSHILIYFKEDKRYATMKTDCRNIVRGEREVGESVHVRYGAKLFEGRVVGRGTESECEEKMAKLESRLKDRKRRGREINSFSILEESITEDGAATGPKLMNDS